MADITIVQLPADTDASPRETSGARLSRWLAWDRRREPPQPTERRAAWEIAEVANIEKYDVAPWLFF